MKRIVGYLINCVKTNLKDRNVRYDGKIMGLSIRTNSETQIDFDLATQQLVPIEKLLQYTSSKDFSTNTIGESKDSFLYALIVSFEDHINSLENQLKYTQKILDRLLNLKS